LNINGLTWSDPKMNTSKKEDAKLETEIGEVIAISDALNRLSDKYNISKPIISSIIIDKKMLERRGVIK
jgi:hypothetical protein